jgi:photosystem II stability/assembly factor-like uncharacterized protein
MKIHLCGLSLLVAAGSVTGLAAAEPTNQWYLRGPDGGYANQVAIDAVSHMPVAGGAAGAFRYEALAGAWSYSNTGAPTALVAGIATTPSATFINSGGYVARSTDGGVTWTNVSSMAMGSMVSSIATSAASATRVYATVNPNDPTNSDPRGGLWISDDLGANWTQSALTSGANMRLVRASPTDANLIFVAGSPNSSGVANVFRSTDGGVTFGAGPAPVIQSGGTPALPLSFVDIVQDPFDALRIVALSAPEPGYSFLDSGGEVWVSHDAGVTWGTASNNNFVLAPETTGGGEPRALLFDHLTANVVYFATTWGVFKGGTAPPALMSSGMVQMGPRNSGVRPYDEVDALAQAADGTLYAATTSGGVFISTNAAANWIPISNHYTGLNIRTFAFQPGNTGVVLAGSADPSNLGGVYRSADAGLTWTRSSSGMYAGALRGMAFSPNGSLVIAAGFKQGNVGGEQNRGLWRSNDAGLTWSRIDDSGLSFNNNRIVVFDPNDAAKVLVSGPVRLNLSANGGVNWINSINSPGSFGGLPFANNPDLALLGLAAGPKPGGGTRFYASVLSNVAPGTPLPAACQSDSNLPCKGGVYYSDDGGYNWVRGSGISGDSSSYLSVGASAGTVYASQTIINGYPGGVYKSTDYGVTWSDRSTGLPCRYIFTVAADPSDAQVAWSACAFTDITHPGGIFRSNDGGAHWVPYGRGLRNLAIEWLTVDPANAGHVLAGGVEGVEEMHFAPDTDQDGIPDSEEALVGANGDANADGTPDAGQADVASSDTSGAPFAAARTSGAAGSNYVVVEIDHTQPTLGLCQFVSDLVVVPTDQIEPSPRMVQVAPTIRFILPNCQQATVKIRYSAVSSYPSGVFGSYSPVVAGDASTLAWGLLDAAVANQSGGVWSLHLDQNAYGNVYAANAGSILFHGAPGKSDAIFADDFE